MKDRRKAGKVGSLKSGLSSVTECHQKPTIGSDVGRGEYCRSSPAKVKLEQAYLRGYYEGVSAARTADNTITQLSNKINKDAWEKIKKRLEAER